MQIKPRPRVGTTRPHYPEIPVWPEADAPSPTHAYLAHLETRVTDALVLALAQADRERVVA